MRLLKPVNISPIIEEEISRKILRVLWQELYLPLAQDLKSYGFSVVKNSMSDLVSAIHKGTITFYRGHFKGKFNAQISKELKKIGAAWDFKHSSFKIPKSKLSREITMAISTSEAEWLKKSAKIKEKINQVDPTHISSKIDLDCIISRGLHDLDGKIIDSYEGLVVSPKLTKESVEFIAENYTENMRLYIQEWTEKEIIKLRDKVKVHTFSGMRYEGLAKDIQRSYGVSKTKALFLARQETNLLVAKFKETRYNQVGITKYKWTNVVGSKNHPVRDSHARLNNLVFSFDNPPVVNDRGDRKNPGEDWGCRCAPRPVLEI